MSGDDASSEDPNAKSPTFKDWFAFTKAHNSLFRILLKLADKIDTAIDDDNSDDVYEDIDIDDVKDDPTPEQIVDLDQLKMLSLHLIDLKLVLELTEPVP
jgi:hypothetical protein